jgi:hypothetical protein
MIPGQHDYAHAGLAAPLDGGGGSGPERVADAHETERSQVYGILD